MYAKDSPLPLQGAGASGIGTLTDELETDELEAEPDLAVTTTYLALLLG